MPQTTCPPLTLNTAFADRTGQAFQYAANWFNDIFKPAAGTFREFEHEVLPPAHFASMKVYADDNMPDYAPCKRYFPVLRIFYGLEIYGNVHSIKLIYLPDNAIEHAARSRDFEFNTPLINGEFQPANDAQVFYLNTSGNLSGPENYSVNCKNWVQQYRNSGITMNKYGKPGDTFEELGNHYARGSVFSFQQITEFCGNSSNPIFVTSVAEIDAVRYVATEGWYRHNIMLSKIDPANVSPLVESAVTNLGALCPIRCDKLIFTADGHTESWEINTIALSFF